MTTKLTQSGQTLIALLVFMMLGIVVTTSAVAVTVINIRGNSGFTSSESALENAESALENAMMQLERNPSYGGETITFSESNSAIITVSGSGSLTVTSDGRSGTYQRTVTAGVTYTNNIFTVTSWAETP